MILFEIEGKNLRRRVTLSSSIERTSMRYPLECLGYFDGHIQWLGMGVGNNGLAQVFDFDIKSWELKELRGSRVGIGENGVMKADYCKGSYYYMGKLGKLMKIWIRRD